MKKFFKWFLGIAIIGSVIGLLIAYLCKDAVNDECDDDAGEKDADFNLDSDLKPAKDREYVPLNRGGEETDAKKEAKTEAPESSEEKETV